MMRSQLNKMLLSFTGALVLFLIGLVIYTGLQQNKSTDLGNSPIRVVSSLNSYGEMAEAVLGNQGEVKSVMTNPDVDPHDYEPTANTAKLYERATVTISNGGGYDTWSERFTKANKDVKAVNVVEMYHYQEGQNEHFWYQPDVVNRVTNALVDTYSAIKPDQRAYFEQNAKNYQKKMQKVDHLRTQLKQEMAGKGVLATEPVFDPQLEAVGAKRLDTAFAQAIDEGNDPTPAAMSEWQGKLKNHEAVAVIDNTQSSSKLVKQALQEAKAAGVPIVPVTESMPKNTSYIDWQYNQLKSLQKAVQ